jgi:hypothetical protein
VLGTQLLQVPGTSSTSSGHEKGYRIPDLVACAGIDQVNSFELNSHLGLFVITTLKWLMVKIP